MNAGSAAGRSARTVAVRYEELDGLRGWTALSVVLFHTFWETFGVAFPVFRNAYSAFLMDGSLAVTIFFILSGEALTSTFFDSRSERAVVSLMVKRYLRLTIPIFASCAIVYILLLHGLIFSKQAAAIVGRDDWLGSFLLLDPTFTSLLQYSFSDVYFHHSPSTSYNPFLWTMSIEMLGSVALFAFCLGYRYLRYRGTSMVLVAIGLWFGDTALACFFMGMIFGRARARGLFDSAVLSRPSSRLALIAVCVLALTIETLARKSFLPFAMGHQLEMLVAFVLLAAIFASTDLRRVLQTRLSQRLGALSFPLYLVHFAVIASLASYLIVTASQHEALTASIAIGIGATTVVCSFVAAALFSPIEGFTRIACSRLAQFALADAEDRPTFG